MWDLRLETVNARHRARPALIALLEIILFIGFSIVKENHVTGLHAHRVDLKRLWLPPPFSAKNKTENIETNVEDEKYNNHNNKSESEWKYG